MLETEAKAVNMQCCGPYQNSNPDPGCFYYLDTTGSLVDPALNLRAGFQFKSLRFHRACGFFMEVQDKNIAFFIKKKVK
jgi:hypothetical protein